MAEGAFADPASNLVAIEIQKARLEAIEVARVRLDEVRGQNPED
jgi:hypothetical protein